MENFNNELIGLSAAAVVVILILRMVFDFVQKMKTTAKTKGHQEEPTKYVGFGEIHAQCLSKIEYQVNEMFTGLQVSKELQTAIASVINMQEQQTAILNQLTKLSATSQQLLEQVIGKNK